jgi:hypothetical protein
MSGWVSAAAAAATAAQRAVQACRYVVAAVPEVPLANASADLDLQISDQTIYTWRRQEAIDTGRLPGVTSGNPPVSRQRLSSFPGA